MADLTVVLCGKTLKNPVIPASGTFGFGREFDDIYDISCLGGVATKGIALVPWGRNPVPRIAESRGVILNAVGLQNPGVEKFIAEDLAWLKQKTRVIANVVGRTIEDYEGVCARLDGLVDFLELNISCPNVKCGGMAFGIRPENIEEVTARAKAKCPNTPLIVKLSPNVESITRNAQAAARGGARRALPRQYVHGACHRHRTPPSHPRQQHGRRVGGGHQTHRRAHGLRGGTCGQDSRHRHGRNHLRRGCGGIPHGGATAVQVGTQNFTDTRACPKIIAGLNEWCDSHKVARVADLTDTLQLNG